MVINIGVKALIDIYLVNSVTAQGKVPSCSPLLAVTRCDSDVLWPTAWQWRAVTHGVTRCDVMWRNVTRCYICCNTLWHVVTRCKPYSHTQSHAATHTITCCHTLTHAVTRWHTLSHTATHTVTRYNTQSRPVICCHTLPARRNALSITFSSLRYAV